MQDAFGRTIDYARISLTQRCNLRCTYCRPEDAKDRKQAEWTREQLAVLFAALADMQFRKIRFTGGEPSLRSDLETIVAMARDQGVFSDIAMTSNGQQLAQRLPGLQKAGLMRLNLSLDTCRTQRYYELTGGGDIEQVYEAMDVALSLGMPVKINALLMRNWSEQEIDALMALAKDRPVQVRFIERMPFGPHAQVAPVLTQEEVVKQRPALVMQTTDQTPGQSVQVYRMDGYKGTIGFISPMSHCFCMHCNRLRFTSDAACRPCLGDPKQISLSHALAQGVEETVRLLQQAVMQKPAKNRFAERFTDEQGMHHIGG